MGFGIFVYNFFEATLTTRIYFFNFVVSKVWRNFQNSKILMEFLLKKIFKQFYCHSKKFRQEKNIDYNHTKLWKICHYSYLLWWVAILLLIVLISCGGGGRGRRCISKYFSFNESLWLTHHKKKKIETLNTPPIKIQSQTRPIEVIFFGPTYRLWEFNFGHRLKDKV